MLKPKVFILILAQFIFVAGFAQSWQRGLNKFQLSKKSPNFYEIENVFNEYNRKHHVTNGIYVLSNGQRVKSSGWKQFKRWQWYWEQRIEPGTGKFPKKNSIAIYEKYLGKRRLKQKNSQTGNWISLGSDQTTGGYAGLGRINCISFHPTDTSTYWVGTPAGGVWKTTDDGASWTVLTDKNPVLGVSSIAIPSDYATSKTIYIATGDRDNGSMWSLGGSANDNNSIGVLKSSDGGQSWQTTGLSFLVSDEKMVTKIAISPQSNNTLFASTSNGFYKSTDAGATWTLLNSLSFIDFEFNPSNSSIIYASTQDWYSTKIYKTTDGGSNWTQIVSHQGKRTELAVSSNQPDWVYAVVVNGDGGLEGIYKSTDQGASYNQLIDGSKTNNNYLGYYSDGSGGTTGQGDYDICLAADPNDANKVYLGGVNSWKSSDGGTSWTIMNMWTSGSSYNISGAPTVHADKHYMAFRNNSSVLFEANDGGIYKSYNDGSVWINKTNGITNSQIYRISASQTMNGTVLTGLQDNGSKLLWKNNWYDVTGGDGMNCEIDYSDVSTEYASYAQGEIYRTEDTWTTQTTISDNIGDGTLQGAWLTPYKIAPQNPNKIYVAYDELWMSTDKGNSFTKKSNLNLGTKLKVLAMSASDSLSILVGTRTSLYLSRNGGGTWTDITGSLPVNNNSITNILFKSDDANTIWLTLGSYDGNQIYQTTDGGTNWINISQGLPNIPAMCIIQNRKNTQTAELYAGMDVGVYVKYGTSDWQLFSQDLPNVVVSDLSIYYDSLDNTASRIYAATFGRGVWSSDLYDNSGVINPANFTSTPAGSQQIDLSWILNADNNPVLLAYSETGTFGQPENGKTYSVGTILNGGGTIIYSGSSSVFSHTGLKARTKYYYKIWSQNTAGNYSSGVYKETVTDCELVNLPFKESFDAVGIPECWSQQSYGGATDRWTVENSNNANGSPLELVASYEDVADGVSRVVLPRISLVDVSKLKIAFDYYFDDYDIGMFVILQASTDKQNWVDMDTLITSGTGTISARRDSFVYDLPFGQQNTYFAFAVKGNLYSFNYLYIDNLSLSESIVLSGAPVWSDIPDQAIFQGSSFSPIDLKNFIIDDLTAASDMNYSYSGNKDIAINISNGIATFTLNSSTWTGIDTIVFTATDQSGFSDSQTVLFSVKKANTAPVLQSISDQTIFSGEQFNAINLDLFVTDDYTADQNILWTISGMTNLDVTLSNRIAQISAKDKSWTGSEKLTFTAQDEGGLKDSVSAIFTILPKNNAPIISAIQKQEINKGESFADIYLDEYVSDDNTPDSLVKWSYFGATNLNVDITNRIASISSKQSDWTGTDTVFFVAEDEQGLKDTAQAVFTIKGTTGIEPYWDLNNKLRVFPNPSTGIVFLEFQKPLKKELSIKVINSEGKMVDSRVITMNKNSYELNLKTMTKGIYYIRLSSENKFINQKVIIK